MWQEIIIYKIKLLYKEENNCTKMDGEEMRRGGEERKKKKKRIERSKERQLYRHRDREKDFH